MRAYGCRGSEGRGISLLSCEDKDVLDSISVVGNISIFFASYVLAIHVEQHVPGNFHRFQQFR
jgi:hypothetical protein